MIEIDTVQPLEIFTGKGIVVTADTERRVVALFFLQDFTSRDNIVPRFDIFRLHTCLGKRRGVYEETGTRVLEGNSFRAKVSEGVIVYKVADKHFFPSRACVRVHRFHETALEVVAVLTKLVLYVVTLYQTDRFRARRHLRNKRALHRVTRGIFCVFNRYVGIHLLVRFVHVFPTGKFVTVRSCHVQRTRKFILVALHVFGIKLIFRGQRVINFGVDFHRRATRRPRAVGGALRARVAVSTATSRVRQYGYCR